MIEESSPLSVEDARGDIAAYAFGIADLAEAEAVRRLLQSDDAAAADLAAFEKMREALLHASPARKPPPALEARLRSAIGGESNPIQTTARATSRPAAGWQERFGNWFAPQTRPVWALAAGAVILLLITNVWWGVQNAALRQQQLALQTAMTAQTDLSRLMTAQAQETTLPAPEAGDARARLYWDPDGSVAVLLADAFPALEPGKVYQVWLIEGDQRTSAATFRVSEEGSGMTLIHSPKPLQHYDAVGITPEPEGGSPGPTAPPVVRGPLSL